MICSTLRCTRQPSGVNDHRPAPTWRMKPPRTSSLCADGLRVGRRVAQGRQEELGGPDDHRPPRLVRSPPGVGGPDAGIRRVGTLSSTFALLAVLGVLAASSPAAAAPTCAETLLARLVRRRDDRRGLRTRAATGRRSTRLPEDVRVYTTAADDISRALRAELAAGEASGEGARRRGRGRRGASATCARRPRRPMGTRRRSAVRSRSESSDATSSRLAAVTAAARRRAHAACSRSARRRAGSPDARGGAASAPRGSRAGSARPRPSRARPASPSCSRFGRCMPASIQRSISWKSSSIRMSDETFFSTRAVRVDEADVAAAGDPEVGVARLARAVDRAAHARRPRSAAGRPASRSSTSHGERLDADVVAAAATGRRS